MKIKVNQFRKIYKKHIWKIFLLRSSIASPASLALSLVSLHHTYINLSLCVILWQFFFLLVSSSLILSITYSLSLFMKLY